MITLGALVPQNKSHASNQTSGLNEKPVSPITPSKLNNSSNSKDKAREKENRKEIGSSQEVREILAEMAVDHDETSGAPEETPVTQSYLPVFKEIGGLKFNGKGKEKGKEGEKEKGKQSHQTSSQMMPPPKKSPPTVPMSSTPVPIIQDMFLTPAPSTQYPLRILNAYLI